MCGFLHKTENPGQPPKKKNTPTAPQTLPPKKKKPSHPATLFQAGLFLTHFPDDEMEQVSFLPPVHETLACPLRPNDHLNIGGRIIRHQMDHLAYWYGRQ